MTKKAIKKSNKISLYIVLLLTLVGLAVFALIYLLSTLSSPGTDNLKKLKAIEVQEYQGENLSSITDFLENSIKGPQYIDIQNYVLNIDGLVKNTKSLTYDQVIDRDKYSKVVTLHCVEGWSVKILWEGVLLKDILNEAGIKPGSNTVIFHAYDGYSSSLPLDFILNNNILLAYKMNGVVIPPERGFPFMVVAESKWGYKWVKWVTRIEVGSDPSYKGYWEKEGYSQDGDIHGPKFE